MQGRQDRLRSPTLQAKQIIKLFAASPLIVFLLAVAFAPIAAATILVTNTSDGGSGSLRQAILDANAAPGPDTIAFLIPAASDPNCNAATGVCTITPASGLPFVSGTATIDGYTQSGAVANTNPTSMGTNAVLHIELNLTNAGLIGILLSGDGSTVRGLALTHVSFGVVLQGTGSHTVEGNFIGTNVIGTASSGGTGNGVVVSAGSINNLIGGTSPAARNLISGIGTGILLSSASVPIIGTKIQGNLIGTNAAGTAAVPNDASIAMMPAQNTLIGGTTAGARNIISGNTGGISDQSNYLGMPSGNLIQGNYIGVDVTGNAALGNGNFGVALLGRGTTLGGSTPGAGNVIAANGPSGNVNIGGQMNVVQGNYIGTNAAGTSAPIGSPASGIATPGIFVTGNLGTLGSMIGGSVAGAGNVIAFNSAHGVLVDDITGPGHSILGNSIFSNARLGIDLYRNGQGSFGVNANDPGDGDGGANGLQNYPVLTSVAFAGGNVSISGALNSTASATFRVELFSNATCDASGSKGRSYLQVITRRNPFRVETD